MASLLLKLTVVCHKSGLKEQLLPNGLCLYILGILCPSAYIAVMTLLFDQCIKVKIMHRFVTVCKGHVITIHNDNYETAKRFLLV